MIRIRVIPAHSCSAITNMEHFKWTQILGDVVPVTTSNTCKTGIMVMMPALAVTRTHSHGFSRSRRILLPLTCRWEMHHGPVPASLLQSFHCWDQNAQVGYRGLAQAGGSVNHRMAWVVKDLEGHLASMPLLWAECKVLAVSERIQRRAKKCSKGWDTSPTGTG